MGLGGNLAENICFSADIYEKEQPKIEALGLKTDCVGGGRIEHNRLEKKILVYGYSMVRNC